MDDPIRAMMFPILERADEQGLVYPLRITLEAADGEQIYEVSAKGGTPVLTESTFDFDTGVLRSPLRLVVRDSTEPPREIHSRVALGVNQDEEPAVSPDEGDTAVITVTEYERSTGDNDPRTPHGERPARLRHAGGELRSSTIFVKSTDPQRLKLLNDAVKAGGNPIGLIAGDFEDGRLKVSRKIFPENADHAAECGAYFDRLTGELEGLLKAEIGKRSRGPEKYKSHVNNGE